MAEEEAPVVPEEEEEEGAEPQAEPVAEPVADSEVPPTTDEPPPEARDAAEPAEETVPEPAPFEGAAETSEPAEETVLEPAPPEEKPTDKRSEKSAGKKDDGVKRLFDSKGSLLDTESFVRDRLEEYKKKRAAFAVEIKDLQAKVIQYKEKENPTDDDIAHLKKYHAAFLQKLGEFEEMTRNVEKLMGMSDVPTSQLDMRMSAPPLTKPPKPEKPEKRGGNWLDTFNEDKLPKLIVCGTDVGDNVPRIIVCEPLKRTDMEPFSKFSPRKESNEPSGVMMNKLNECYELQQRLAAENAQICEMKCKLQSELLDKQETLDCLRQKLMTLESEKYKLCSENNDLQKKLMYASQTPNRPKMCKRELYMKFRGSAPDCPDTDGRYPPGACEGESARGQKCPPGCCQDMANLEGELEKMDNDVQVLYDELENLQRDKTELGYSTASCCSSPRRPVCKLMLPQKGIQTDEDKEKDIFFESDKDPKYNDLREQYQRLHGDFKTKVAEVATLRVELDKTKKDLDDITVLHHELELMHQRELDQNLALKSDKYQVQGLKDQLLDWEQQANVAKQMYKSSQDEVDEMRALIEDQASMLDDYRNKYMRTLQIAEELKKENEFKERECADQIAIEIQRAKLEMQEQLEELSPIKDLLKISQQKLKETEQMHTIALETIADMSKKLEDSQNEIEFMKSKLGTQDGKEDLTANLQFSLEEAEKKMTALESDNLRLKEVITQLESVQTAHSQRLEEKSHELLQMISQLETLREESARQVARVKERSEMVRKCMQAQIAEMEREVAQCRAATAFANRERDEIKSRLQLEVCLLSDNFRESQNRIVQLQQHVNYLSASHPTALIDLV